MEFPKDILLIDFEASERDPDRAEPTQFGGLLLDKASLEEKDSLVTYIAADLRGRVSKASGITQEMLEGAPTKAEVGQRIFEKFGTNVFLGSWVANKDRRMLEKVMAAFGIDYDQTYDFHVIDIWPTAYIHLLKRGYTGSMGSEEMFQAFGAPPRGHHDALEDCRIAADILRKLCDKNSA